MEIGDADWLAMRARRRAALLAARDVLVRKIVENLKFHYPVPGRGTWVFGAHDEIPWPRQTIAQTLILRYSHPYIRIVNATLETGWLARTRTPTVCALCGVLWPCAKAARVFLGLPE